MKRRLIPFVVGTALLALAYPAVSAAADPGAPAGDVTTGTASRGGIHEFAAAARKPSATTATSKPNAADKLVAQYAKTKRFTLLGATRTGERETLDLGKPGPGIGDQIIAVEALYDATGKVELGQISATCQQLPLLGPDDPDFIELRCSFAFEFLKTSTTFQIYTEGEYQISSLFPVLGGTGPFKKAAGQIRISESPDQQGRFSYTFDLR